MINIQKIFFIILLISTQLVLTDNIKRLEYCYFKNSSDEILSDLLFENIQTLFRAKIFFETGTYLGDTVARALDYFDEVYTVGLDIKLFEKINSRFEDYGNVYKYFGPSAEIIKNVCPDLNKKVVFLLNGYFKDLDIDFSELYCPLKKELSAIKESGLSEFVILINDFKYKVTKSDQSSLFNYSSFLDFKRYVQKLFPGYYVYSLGDITIIFSEKENIEVSDFIKSLTWFYCTNRYLTPEEIQYYENLILNNSIF